MAVIDSKKLLPPSKSSGSALATQKFLVPVENIKPRSSAIVKASDILPSKKDSKELGGKITLNSEIVKIHKQAIQIEKIIGSNNTLLKGIEESKRKDSEKQKFEKREKQLEEKKGSGLPSLKAPSLPRTGFLDAIKRFLFYTLLGAAFVKFGKYIPKILEFTKKLIPAIKFLENFAGNILNGVVDFVDKGYKAYDKVREIAKNIGGENLQSKFDEFSKQFNTFANLAIIAGLAATGGTDFSSGGKPTIRKPGFDRVRGGRVDRATQSRYLSRYGKDAFAKRFGQRGLTKLAGKALGRVPIIGGLIDFIISTVIFREKPGRAAAKAIGATIGSALGTFVPVPFAGTILGGILGDIVGGALYDSLVGSDSLKARAQGGQVTRGGKKVSGPSRRIKRVVSRPPKSKPQRTIPGKDIGGKKEIEKLFPSSLNPNVKSPLGVLETTSTNLKEIPLLGGIMGASLDLVMGQKPDANVFKKISIGFGSLIQNAINSETSRTISNVQKEIAGLAGGGIVPRTLSSDENIGMKIGERIGKTLEIMVNSKVTETLQAIRQQLGKEGFEGSPTTGPTGELATGTIARGQLTIEQLVGLAKGAGFSQSDAVIMAAVAMAESSGISTRSRSDTDVHGLWQIRFPVHEDKLKRLGITSRDQLYDPVANAAAAKAVYDSQGITAWSAYTDKNYQKYLGSAQKASSAPAITVYKPILAPDIQKGTGSLSYVRDARGTRLAGDLGDFMKSWGGVPGSIWQHSRHGGQGYRNYPSFHNVDRAIDLGANANEQGPILKKLEEFNRMKGVRPVQIFHAGNDPSGQHNDHVHVAYEKGGKVPGLTKAILGEKGPEFVLDTDTTSALEQTYPGFLDALNKANYKGALQVLQNYASYYNPTTTSTVLMQRVIVKETVSMNMSSGMGGGSIDNSTSSNNSTAALSIG